LKQRELVKEDIEAAIEKEGKTSREFLVKELLKVYDKHLVLNTEPCKFTYDDFQHFMHAVVSSVRDVPKGVMISGREVPCEDHRMIGIIETLINVLNSKECLKKLPKMDYTQKRISR